MRNGTLELRDCENCSISNLFLAVLTIPSTIMRKTLKEEGKNTEVKVLLPLLKVGENFYRIDAEGDSDFVETSNLENIEPFSNFFNEGEYKFAIKCSTENARVKIIFDQYSGFRRYWQKYQS